MGRGGPSRRSPFLKRKAMETSKRRTNLSSAELRRLEHFEHLRDELERDGWHATELVLAMEHVARRGMAMGAALCVPFAIAWLAFWGLHAPSLWQVLACWIANLVLIPTHEAIHGITWAACNPSRFKAIEFGFMKESCTPYCTCVEPLGRTGYIVGALAPLVLLGIAPAIAGIALGNGVVFALALLMILGASGDILVAAELLRHKSAGSELICVDHPSECGLVVFER